MRVSRTSIPLRPRIRHGVWDQLFVNYFREPRNDALPLRESFKITVGITFFDAFEERTKFLLR
jgi:hypothetical protein